MHGRMTLHLILISVAYVLGPMPLIDVRTKAFQRLRHGRDRPRRSHAAFAQRIGRAADNYGSLAIGRCDRGPHSGGPPDNTRLTASSDKCGIPQIAVRDCDIPACAGENDLIVILKRNSTAHLPRMNRRVRKVEIERERTN